MQCYYYRIIFRFLLLLLLLLLLLIWSVDRKRMQQIFLRQFFAVANEFQRFMN